MILSTNSLNAEEIREFFAELASKYFKFIIIFGIYTISLNVLFSFLILTWKTYNYGWSSSLFVEIILKIVVFGVSLIGIYVFHRVFKKRKNFHWYHDFFMFMYIISVSIFQIYNSFHNNNENLPSGKYYYSYAFQTLVTSLYAPWMTILNEKLKMAAIIIANFNLYFYTTYLNNDLSNYEITKSTIYFLMRSLMDCKISSIFLILIKDIYKIIKEKKNDNLSWKKLIDEMPLGFTIISKFSNEILFINKYAKEIFEFQKNEKNCFNILNEHIGKMTYLANIKYKYKNYSEKKEFEKLINNSKLIDLQKHYSLKEILHLLSYIKDGEVLEDQLLNLETTNNEFKKLSIKIDPNIYFNKMKCYSIFFEDLSLAETNKSLKQNCEFQSNLLKSFSHELKTPLNSSIPLLEMGISSILQQEEIVQKVFLPALKSIKLLDFVLSSIIDLNSISSNQFVLNVVKINFRDFIVSLFSLVEPQSEQKSLRLIFIKDEDVSDDIYTDPQRLSILLLNLLTNALKFTYNGEIKILVSKKSANVCKISVIDTGIGISESVLEKMNGYFEKKPQESSNFFSFNDSGTCLGLNISNELAYILSDNDCLYQRRLVAESSNQGSTFSFEVYNHAFEYISNRKSSKKLSLFIFDQSDEMEKLNLVNNSYNFSSFPEIGQEKDEILLKIERKSILNYRFFGKRSPLFPAKKKDYVKQIDQGVTCDCFKILIVDDDPFNQLSLELILKKLGFKSKKANNGLEAINILKKSKMEERCSDQCHSCDIIFMDYQMPIMNGVEASNKIKEMIKNKVIDDVIVIGCTAFCTKWEVEKFWNAKIDDLIIKPVNVSKIQELMEKWNFR